MVSGTPTAIADADPKLVVMSLRTMPVSVSTLTPLEPSPGYGPAVSSGISVPVDVTVSDSAPVEPPPEVPDGLGESAASDWSVLPIPQLARAAARPAPPNNVSVRLRLSIGRSWERPLSWSCSSSSCVMRSPRSGSSEPGSSHNAGPACASPVSVLKGACESVRPRYVAVTTSDTDRRGVGAPLAP
jgi:hypothetical protein